MLSLNSTGKLIIGQKIVTQIYHPCDVQKFCEHGLLISKSENFIGSDNFYLSYGIV